MNEFTNDQDVELTRLQVLRAYKHRFGGQGETNVSPFTTDRVVRYDTDVERWDVPEIHREVRETIQGIIKGIHQGQPSQVVILAGNPGMGKSHIINHFRSPELARALDYVLVCNSNQWKVNEFEECLLDWVLSALTAPSPSQPHLLLEKVQDIAFQALSRILANPEQIHQFKRKGASGVLERLKAKLVGNVHAQFLEMAERRDNTVFQRLDFPKFAGYVCDLFLRDSGNPLHRYVMRVLLQYLFPEDRETVQHWLRGKTVPTQFLARLGAEERLDRQYKMADALKILISLFTPEVTRNLHSEHSPAGPDKVFFFAFDQMEGRQELFESEKDWFTFFAQLSELYNALPNVFILFTMTVKQRESLYGRMERQFQHRIRRDQKFVLHDIPDDEVLMLYRRRLEAWLGPGFGELRTTIEQPPFRYLPLTQDEVLKLARFKPLRETLEALDQEFRHCLLDLPGEDPRYDYLVWCKEFRPQEQTTPPFDYSKDHLALVKQLFDQTGPVIAAAAGLSYADVIERPPQEGLNGLRLEFRDPQDATRWVRVFLVRLPFRYGACVKSCIDLLYSLQRDRNFLWLVRPERIDESLADKKPGQVFPRELPANVHTTLRALLEILARKDGYRANAWQEAERLLSEELKATYLGEMLRQVREAMTSLRGPAQDELTPAGQT